MKLGRALGAGTTVLHKAGWVNAARHDAGLLVWRGGILVATVMTYRSAGAGTSSDVLAGNVARAALRRFRQLEDPGKREGAQPAPAPSLEPASALGVRRQPIRCDPREAVRVACASVPLDMPAAKAL